MVLLAGSVTDLDEGIVHSWSIDRRPPLGTRWASLERQAHGVGDDGSVWQTAVATAENGDQYTLIFRAREVVDTREEGS